MIGGQTAQPDLRRPIQGGIHIEIQKTGFLAGDLIEGQLKVFLEESYVGRILQISLEGLEQSFYKYEQEVNYKMKDFTAQGVDTFVDFQIPVHDFSQGIGQSHYVIQPGQWQIPFQLKLSETLPTSFQTGYIQGFSFGNVRYNLVATILPEDSSVRPLQAKQELYISNAFKVSSDPPPVRTLKFAMRAGCCGDQEDIFTMNVSTDKLVYRPGEFMTLTYSAELTNVPVNQVQIEIEQSMTLKNHQNLKKEKKTIFELEKNIPVKDKKSIKETVRMQIPVNALLTYDGNIVDIKTKIEIDPKVDVICTDTSFPIVIGPPPFLLPEKFPQKLSDMTPKNWNPIILEAMTFNPEQVSQIQFIQAKYKQQQLEYNLQNSDQSQLIGVNTSQQPLNIPQMYPMQNVQGQQAYQQNFR